MGKLTERRKFERYTDQTSIVYAIMDSTNYNNARMQNCSMGGMFFNSNYAIDTETEVCIKMLDFCSIFQAKVVRCNVNLDDEKTSYGVGIEYLEPVD